ncbi:uncharacterized protein LOC104905717 isoform X3 [Beta vulgaris subsp. vulgaris]|uniref:uncharacterized protein LOC104905717 isoform X3 n=1 Tax=Beta vulgaris subsp. vulgaris TaxID=3555 RepID=UPI00053FA472|nr:uncharacterized protein LOC104905717 isoform X3 [Beta vulgaris subsp. vulgaris]
MVVAVEARKLSLPHLSLSSPQVTSLLYEPNSLSLALMHSDSTFSLFPSFSPFSISNSLPPPQTLIPPPSSSACFVPLKNPNPKIEDCPDDKRAVFVTAGPHNGGSRVVLRFYLLGKDGKFVNSNVICSQNGVCFDRKFGVIVDVSHGMKVMLSGCVNYLAMYSASGGKILVFGLKLVGDGRDLRLVKCAVVDCRLPVSTICLSFGFLIMGELRGVRVFPLRALVKGRVKSGRKMRVTKGKGENLNVEVQEVNVKVEIRNSKRLNGVVRPLDESYQFDKSIGNLSSSKLLPNGHAYSVLNAVSSSSSNVDGTDSQTVWISDGLYSVHLMVISSSETTDKDKDGSNNEGEIIQSSVTQTIFMSESIQDMMPLAANRVLILGQDNLYTYAIS